MDEHLHSWLQCLQDSLCYHFQSITAWSAAIQSEDDLQRQRSGLRLYHNHNHILSTMTSQGTTTACTPDSDPGQARRRIASRAAGSHN